MTATTKTEVTALTVVERAAVALGSSKLEGELAALAKNSADITEIKNAAGREQCHSAMMGLANTRTSITKTGKAARDDANAFSKAVIAEEKRLVELIEPEEIRLRDLRDQWDEAREAEKRAKAEAEARRIAAIREHIDDIRAIPGKLLGQPSSRIQIEIDDLAAVQIGLDRFAELTGEATTVRDAVLDYLRGMHTAAVEQEAEAARVKAEQEAEAVRLAAEREELARLRAEAAKRDEEAAAARAAEEQRIAAERAETDRIALERLERLEAEEAELRAERKRQAAEAERLADEREALERRQREEEEARQRQQRESEEAAAREQQQRERVDFIVQGPGRDALVDVLAKHYGVETETVLHWLFIYDIPAAN